MNILRVIQYTGLAASSAALFLCTASGQIIQNSAPNPANSSLLLWLDASAGVTTDGNGAVTSWANQATSSVVGNAISSGTSGVLNPAYQQSSSLNGKAALNFTGSNGLDIQNASSLLRGGDYSVFVVYKAFAGLDWDHAQTLLQSNYNSFYIASKRRFSYQENGSADWATMYSADWAIAGGTDYVLGLVSGGTAAGDSKLLINGERNDDGTAMPIVNNTASVMNLGYDPNNASRFSNGLIAEVLIYDRALSQSEIDSVNAYLGNKYNIPVVIPEPAAVLLPSSVLLVLGVLSLRKRRKLA